MADKKQGSGEKKDSPNATRDDATGRKPQHTQDVPNNESNKPAEAASDKDNDGKPDKREAREKEDKE